MSLNTILATTPNTSTNYILKATGTSIGNSLIYDNGTNVAIGGTTMSSIFNLNGTDPLISFQNAGSTKWQVGLENTASNRFIWYDNTAAAYRMVITSAGNVGIGTSSPNNSASGRTVLDINGTSTSWINQSVGGTSISYIGANSTNAFWNTDGAYFLAIGTNNTERMRITSSGNVGIGTSNPTNSVVQIKGANNTVSGYDDGLKVTSNNETVYVNYNWTGINANDTLRLATVGTERMRITSGGRVGIQNTAPQGKLEVGIVDSTTTQGGLFFSTFQVPVNTWYTVFYAPNNTWNAITEFTWTSAADYNRSGAAYMRWAYNGGSASLGVVYTLFNNDQNAAASFRNNSGQIQVYITGGAADYYVQVRIQGSRAA